LDRLSTIALLRKKEPELYSTNYIGAFLQSQYQYLRSKTTGATIPHISRKALDELRIPVISLNDQLHIATILSKAENLIAQRKESIRLLDEYLKSVFLEMFGDPVRNERGWKVLSGNDYLSKLTVGVVIKPASYYVNDGVIALRSLNIRPNRIQLNNLVYFSKSANETELSKSILYEGDVVFVRTGMTGTAAIIPKELNGCNCIDLIITRPKHGVINPHYLVFFFNSDLGKRIVSAKEVGGIQKHFNIGALRKLKIPVPPIELQIKFSQKAAKIEILKTQFEQSLQELENLYGSLSQRAFRGEIRLKH
jgi:type I restriction enzyme S subunit